MIGRPQRRSMSLALAVIAMSIAPWVAPARNVAADKDSSDRAKPRPARVAAKPKPATTDAGPLRKRWAKRPMSGIAMIAPAAKARSAKLRVTSESARSALTRGIAAAQQPTPAPLATKTPVVARRCGQGRAPLLSGASASCASINWVLRIGLSRAPPLTRLRRLRSANVDPALGECPGDGFRRVRFEDHAVKAFGAADGDRRAGFELFVKERRRYATRIAQNCPFDLGVLRIERGNSRYRIERADAEERKIGAQRLDVGQSPAAESGADLWTDAT